MDPAELGDRVVPELTEHPGVELLGASQSNRGVEARVTGHIELFHELVQEEPTQALGGP